MYREQKGLICLYKFVVDVIVCCRILSFVRHLAGRCFRTRYLCSTIEPLAEKGLSRRERSQIRRRTNLSRPCNFFPSRLFFFFSSYFYLRERDVRGETRDSPHRITTPSRFGFDEIAPLAREGRASNI